MIIEELYEKIKKIVYDVPDSLFKYSKPGDYWDDNEWAKTPSNEKGFILIREIIEDTNNDDYEYKKDNNINLDKAVEINLGDGPRFFNHADENMFFNAIYSMANYLKIVGSGRGLLLYCKNKLTNEEKNYLIGLLMRYKMKIPKELKVD